MKLKSKSALIVGAGGLGCPAALYLAGAGIGRLGIVDHDLIDTSNLHRQIAHDTSAVGTSKAHNLARKCANLNPLVVYEVHECAFERSVALKLVDIYDVVLDCTDNVMTRYLVSDACVLLGKSLVSGSALKFEAQLSVYNHLAEGACYRCVYPRAPPAHTVSTCADAGIMGPVVGCVGALQALEAIKILSQIGYG